MNKKLPQFVIYRSECVHNLTDDSSPLISLLDMYNNQPNTYNISMCNEHNSYA